MEHLPPILKWEAEATKIKYGNKRRTQAWIYIQAALCLISHVPALFMGQRDGSCILFQSLSYDFGVGKILLHLTSPPFGSPACT